MRPGPRKSFDPDEALGLACKLFWRKGYDGTGISDLELAMGIGRKSLYDTFGNKRGIFLASIRHYSESVLQRISQGLRDPRNSAFANLERVLGRLQTHHASPESLGCLLGVAMAQLDPEDQELSGLLRQELSKLEAAFEHNLRAAKKDGDLKAKIRPKDSARQLVALTQGMAVMARLTNDPIQPRSMVRSALDGLKS